MIGKVGSVPAEIAVAYVDLLDPHLAIDLPRLPVIPLALQNRCTALMAPTAILRRGARRTLPDALCRYALLVAVLIVVLTVRAHVRPTQAWCRSPVARTTTGAHLRARLRGATDARR